METLAGIGDAEWDETVLALPEPHLLQGGDWGGLKARWGWQVHRQAWRGGARADAVAQVLVRRVGRSPFRIGYVPRGPLLTDPTDPVAWRVVLRDLAIWARNAGLVLLRIDPDVPRSSTAVAEAWRAQGWRPAAVAIQFPNTMVSDLSMGETALLAGMRSKTRYNIRLAERRGVTIRRGDAHDLEVFLRLYRATAARGGFGLRDPAYYLDAWSTFLSAGRATVLLAERSGEALAGVIPVAYGPTAWYLYGASGDDGREHMPTYLAQWHSLRWAISRGCRRYDWWGGPTRLDPGDPLWGVYQFKRGFGAAWVDQLGAWDLRVAPLRGAWYQAMEQVRHHLVAARAARPGRGRPGVGPL